MTTMLVGMLLFFGIHSVSIVAPTWRDATARRLGEIPWKILYSILSIVGFWFLISGYAAMRLEPHIVYLPPVGLRHVAALLMVPVFPLLLAAYLPGRLQRAAKHPMLVAVKFWALSHLLANGMLADVLLFGGFLVWAIADRISLKRRADRPRPMAPAGAINDVVAVLGGLALYAVFIMGWHQRLFGVAPFG